MKNFKRLFALSLLAASVAVMPSCDTEDDGGKTPAAKKYTLSIAITYPEDVNPDDIQNLNIVASNEKEQSYSLDTVGVSSVQMTVSSGQYRILVGGKITDAITLNGSVSADVYADASASVTMQTVMKSPLVFKSLYYVSYNYYFNDTYFEIVNNSDEVQYLDQCIIGNMTQLSGSPSQWVDESGNLLDRYPFYGYVIAFPGNGTTYPLEPGQSVVVANDATDHTTLNVPGSGEQLSPNLTGADWEIYLNDAGRFFVDNDYAAPNMDVIYCNAQTKAFGQGAFGSAMVMAKLPEGVTPAQFAADSSNLSTIPNTDNTTYYLMMPSMYVLDAVEMMDPDLTTPTKNLHTKDDASFVSMAAWSAKAIVRKSTTDTETGRVYYQDTNDSAKDFLIDQPVVNLP